MFETDIALLPKNLGIDSFLEKDSLLSVVISALLKDDEKKRISPSFCKHKINFEDDVKPVIQRQRRLNPNMKEVVKKRLSNFSTPVSFTLSKIVLGDGDINDNFPDETLMNISSNDDEEIPWFADFANYLDEPHLFKMYPDGMIRRYVYGSETQKILNECHHGPTGGHYGPSTTAKKVFDASFHWQTIFKEAHTLVQNYDSCQRSSSLS
ncbi:reverse transcriptase domain-containing protein [Tanacetum coccineum]